MLFEQNTNLEINHLTEVWIHVINAIFYGRYNWNQLNFKPYASVNSVIIGLDENLSPFMAQS